MARIVSGSWDRAIKVWDASKGEELRSLHGQFGSETRVCISPNNARIASASSDKAIRVWEAASGEELRTLKGHTGNISCVSFNPNGERIYSLADNREQFVWEIETGNRLESELWQDFSQQQQVSGDRRWLVAASDENLQLIDLQFSHRPYEKALRESKARLNPIWHSEQAELAMQNSDWCAATFHRAWVMKADPGLEESFDELHAAWEQWRKQLPVPRTPIKTSGVPESGTVQAPGEQNVLADSEEWTLIPTGNPDDLLAPVVREVLGLPRDADKN